MSARRRVRVRPGEVVTLRETGYRFEVLDPRPYGVPRHTRAAFGLQVSYVRPVDPCAHPAPLLVVSSDLRRVPVAELEQAA